MRPGVSGESSEAHGWGSRTQPAALAGQVCAASTPSCVAIFRFCTLSPDGAGQGWHQLEMEPGGTQPDHGALLQSQELRSPTSRPQSHLLFSGKLVKAEFKSCYKSQVAKHVGGWGHPSLRVAHNGPLSPQSEGGVAGPKLNSFIWPSPSPT